LREASWNAAALRRFRVMVPQSSAARTEALPSQARPVHKKTPASSPMQVPFVYGIQILIKWLTT
jgi:hypothetical protein